MMLTWNCKANICDFVFLLSGTYKFLSCAFFTIRLCSCFLFILFYSWSICMFNCLRLLLFRPICLFNSWRYNHTIAHFIEWEKKSHHTKHSTCMKMFKWDKSFSKMYSDFVQCICILFYAISDLQFPMLCIMVTLIPIIIHKLNWNICRYISYIYLYERISYNIYIIPM